MKKERRKQKDKNKKKKKGFKIFLIILVLIVIAGSVFAYNVHKNGGGLEGLLFTTLGHDENTLKDLDKIYCVLLGQSQNLTDTIILASYDPKTQKASLLSIPRDTFIGDNKNYATPNDKINALCQYDYPEKTVKAVSELTGIDVTNYVLIDTKALVEVVNLIGGVWYDVPIDMNYTDKKQDLYIDLDKGYQLLNGEQAEGLVRFRHNSDGTTYPEEYGAEDIGRTKTQRQFLVTLADQVLTLQNITKLGGLIDIAYKNVKTNMTLSMIKDYLPYAIKFDTDNIKTGILPGTSELCNIVWVYIHDEEETEKIVNELFLGDEQTEVKTTTSNTIEDTTNNVTTQTPVKTAEYDATVEILNGSGSTQTASTIKKQLEKQGFTVETVTETSEMAKTTIINRNNKEDEAKAIKEILNTGTVTTGSKSDSDITIILGKDSE